MKGCGFEPCQVLSFFLFSFVILNFFFSLSLLLSLSVVCLLTGPSRRLCSMKLSKLNVHRTSEHKNVPMSHQCLLPFLAYLFSEKWMVFSTATIAIIGFFLFWLIYIFSESKLNVLFVTLNFFGYEMGSFPDDCLHFMSLLEERRKKELRIFFYFWPLLQSCCFWAQ